MIKRIEVYKLSEDEEDNIEIREWVFQSHYWVEFAVGYFECKWCKATHTSPMPITKDFALCLHNPYVKNLVEDVYNGIK